MWLLKRKRKRVTVIFLCVLQQEEEEGLWFLFQKTKYLYDREEKKTFVPLTFPTHHSVQFYMDWKGYQDDSDVAAAVKKFGTNV